MSFLSNLFNTNPYPVYQVNDNSIETFEQREELYSLIADLVHDLSDLEKENAALYEMLEANETVIDELIDETIEQDTTAEALANALGEVAQVALQALLSLGYDIEMELHELTDED